MTTSSLSLIVVPDRNSCPPLITRNLTAATHGMSTFARRSRSAFTLVELLTVMAIVGVLTGLLVPGLAHAKRTARRTQCLSHLHQVGIGLHNFAVDHGGVLPPQGVDPWDKWTMLLGHIGSPSVLACPADRRLNASLALGELTPAEVSYTWCEQAAVSQPGMLLATDEFLLDRAYTLDTVAEAGWETVISPSHGTGLGNGLLVDGSARVFDAPSLRDTLHRAFVDTGFPHLEFLMPGEDPIPMPLLINAN
jgi:prepilin-type N-terminal cleavage/methylation domain-containing protein